MTGKKSAGNAVNHGHIFRLTDDTGMLQHSKYGIPDPACGYTTDDNARALIMALMLYEKYGKKEYLDLAYRYSSFILNAQNENGRFRNFMGYGRNWLEEEGSEDCFGRCMWAIGHAVSGRRTPDGIVKGLRHVLEKALPNVTLLKSPRGKAYSVIGLACLGKADSAGIISGIAQSLCRQYADCSGKGWKWFENIVAYSNGVMPWSLFAAYGVTGEKMFLEVAEESLGFIEAITFKNGFFKPVGSNGWHKRGGETAEYDEQPVEACETALAFTEAYKATGKSRYREKARLCHEWYEGTNSHGVRLVDDATGGCFDGLTKNGLNLNMGAESLVSYHISLLNYEALQG